MKKYFILGLLLTIFLASVGIVLAAKPNFQPVEVADGRKVVEIPEKAVEVAPGVFYLGKAIGKGEIVEGYAFVDYRKGFGKPTGCNYDGVCQGWEDPSCEDCQGGGGGETSDCYGFLAKGAKWKTVEPYIVNASNTEGLSGNFIRNNLASDIAKWENAAGADILGDETYGVDGADMISPDDKNEVYFGEVDQSGAIAITVVWGVFTGPPGKRKLVEWDQVYDQVDYDWSEDCETEDCTYKMDFENIATHELGHSVGLDDLYTSDCSEQTMYGYANYGETKKRSLEDGDITGISDLY